jgi:imidazolonepropionase-like amidohydrolase
VDAVLINANVVVGNGTYLEDAAISLSDGRIVGVGNKAETGGRQVVDLEGRTVLPGLIDIHTHIAGGDLGPGGFNAEAAHMSDHLIAAVLATVEAAERTLQAGITTIREVGGRDYIDVYLRDAQARGLVRSPRVVASGPGVAMTGGHAAFLDPGNEADGISGITTRVRQLVGNGVDAIKIFSTEGPETSGDPSTRQFSDEEIAAAVLEGHRLNRIVGAHAIGESSIDAAVAAGVDTVEHAWYSSEWAVEKMLATGTYIVPTLGVVTDTNRYGRELLIPEYDIPGDVEAARVNENMRMMFERGIKVAMGSDCGGFGPRRIGHNADELAHYVACGMTPMQALCSGTGVAAEALRLSHEIGTIEPGRAADLVIVDGDPLTDVSLLETGITAVVQRGQAVRDDTALLNRVELHRKRASIPVRS